MADVSLDEVIAQRSIKWSGGRGRGRGRGRGQGRGGGGGRGRGNFNPPSRIQVAKSLANKRRFNQKPPHIQSRLPDARQNIGIRDVRQNIGIRDARQKIGMTDARQKIQQKMRQTDARERLNQKAKKTDARLKLNAKRSFEDQTKQSGSINMEAGTPKITIQNPKAIVNTVNFNATPQQPAVQRLSNKVTANSGELKITTVNEMARKRKAAPSLLTSSPAPAPAPMSYSAYIQRRQIKQEFEEEEFEEENVKEEIFEEDDFQFVEPEPIPPKITRMLQKPAAPPKPKANELLGFGISPLQGTRMHITNLHPTVTEEDIEELFGAVGALKRARLLKQGTAEVVFVRNEDALEAFKAYHNRELDGLPMQCKLDAFGVMSSSSSPSVATKSSVSALASRIKQETGKKTPPEVDPTLIQKALFKTSTAGSTPVRPVTFTVKL
ncbi:uncharacterized protein LOC144435228 [Glandiceps talaboti]